MTTIATLSSEPSQRERIEERTATEFDEHRALVVRVDGARFGLPLADLEDVFVPGVVTRVPEAPDAILGLVNLRGYVVTLVDLRRRLELGSCPAERRPMAVTCGRDGDRYAFLVEAVEEIVSLPAEQRCALPPHLDGRLRDLAQAVYKTPDDLVVVLDVRRLLAW